MFGVIVYVAFPAAFPVSLATSVLSGSVLSSFLFFFFFFFGGGGGEAGDVEVQLSDGFGFSFPSRSVTARYVRDTLPGTKNNGFLKPGTFFLSFFLSLSFCDAMLRPDGGRRSVRARDYRSSHTAFDKCSGQLGAGAWGGGGGGSLPIGFAV